MKKLLSTLVIACFLLAFLPTSAHADIPRLEQGIPITIHVDGRYIASDVDPVIDNGRTLLPMRASAEALNAEVDWDAATQTASLSKDGKKIKFTLGKNVYYIDETPMKTDVAPRIIEGRTVIPLRTFAEALGTKVDWDQHLRDVSIKTNDDAISLPDLPASVPSTVKPYLYKYYVFADPDDPFVGAWKIAQKHSGYHEYGEYTITTTTYEFVSKLKHGEYQVITVTTEEYHWAHPTPIITIFKNNAWKTSTGYKIDGKPYVIFYEGPPRGWTEDGYSEYVLKEQNLIRVSFTDTFGGQNNRFDVYDVFERI